MAHAQPFTNKATRNGVGRGVGMSTGATVRIPKAESLSLCEHGNYPAQRRECCGGRS